MKVTDQGPANPLPNPSNEDNKSSQYNHHDVEILDKSQFQELREALPEKIANPQENQLAANSHNEISAKVLEKGEYTELDNSCVEKFNSMFPEKNNSVLDDSQNSSIQAKNQDETSEIDDGLDLEDFDLDGEYTLEELEALSNALENEDMELENAETRIGAEQQEVETEKQEVDVKQEEIEEGIEEKTAEVETNEKTVDTSKAVMQSESQEVDAFESKIYEKVTDKSTKQAEEKNTENNQEKLEENIPSSLGTGSIGSNNGIDKREERVMKAKMMMSFLSEFHVEMKEAHKTNPTIESEKKLNDVENMVKAFKTVERRGWKDNELEKLFKDMKTEDGRTFDDLSLEEFEHVIKNSNWISYYSRTSFEAEPEKEENKVKEGQANDAGKAEPQKAKGKEAKDDKARFLEQERITGERLHQAVNDKIYHDKEELDKKSMEQLLLRTEARRNKEILKEDVDKGLEKEIAILEKIQKICATITFPVKVETHRMVLSVLRAMESIPNNEKDPGFRDVQKTLISMYVDIKQAIGVEAVNGTGNKDVKTSQ